MKLLYKFIIISAIVVPATTFATYNDVTMTSDTTLQVGSQTVTLNGTTATLESIVVDTSSFTVTLGPNSYISITSPTLNKLTTDDTSDVSASDCNSALSAMTLTNKGTGNVTNVVTPQATICSNTSSTAGGVTSSGNTGGGGGGSGGSGPSNVALPPNPTIVYGTTPPATPGTAPATEPAAAPTATAATTISRDLTVGVSGNDVKALQVLLNSSGFVVATTGGGSPGHESDTFGPATKVALIKFQRAHGLPTTGYLGAQTRAVIRSLSNSSSGATATPPAAPANTATPPANTAPANTAPAVAPAAGSITTDLFIGSQGGQVTALQTMLQAAGYLKVAPTGYYGSQTQAAVKAYQAANNISATGYVGTLTRAALNK